MGWGFLFQMTMQKQLRLSLLCGLLAFGLLAMAPAAPATAANDVKITITVPTAFLRSEPSLLAANTAQVYKGEFYPLTGRSADNAWVRLGTANTSKTGTWLLFGLGALVEGKLADVPVVPP
jgi:hypothetical protein